MEGMDNNEIKLRLDRLAALIEARGITLGQLEIHVGISRSHLSLILNGHRTNVAITSAARLAVFFGVSVDYLLGLTDDPTPASQKDLPPALRDLWETYRRLSPINQTILRYLAGLAAMAQQESTAAEQALLVAAIMDQIRPVVGEEGIGRIIRRLGVEPPAADGEDLPGSGHP